MCNAVSVVWGLTPMKDFILAFYEACWFGHTKLYKGGDFDILPEIA